MVHEEHYTIIEKICYFIITSVIVCDLKAEWPDLIRNNYRHIYISFNRDKICQYALPILYTTVECGYSRTSYFYNYSWGSNLKIVCVAQLIHLNVNPWIILNK